MEAAVVIMTSQPVPAKTRNASPAVFEIRTGKVPLADYEVKMLCLRVASGTRMCKARRPGREIMSEV